MNVLWMIHGTWRSLMTGRPRSASIAASSDVVKCLTISHDALIAADAETWRSEANVDFGELLESSSPSSVNPPVETRKSKVHTNGIGRVDEVPTIVRFKLLKQAVRAFEHASKRTLESWGDEEASQFYNSLVMHLSEAQRAEFRLSFALLDHDSNGEVESWELAKALAIFVSIHGFLHLQNCCVTAC
jgi:hypothetical protein